MKLEDLGYFDPSFKNDEFIINLKYYIYYRNIFV